MRDSRSMALSKKVLGGAIGGQTFIITDMKKDISQNFDINDRYISIIKNYIDIDINYILSLYRLYDYKGLMLYRDFTFWV